MAKRSYMSFYKKGDKAGMRGINTGNTTKTGSDDPEIRAAKRDSARLLNADTSPMGSTAHQWWRRRIKNPRTGETYVVGEDMPFEDFLDFYNFYTSETTNPYRKKRESATAEEGGEPIRPTTNEKPSMTSNIGTTGSSPRMWGLRDAEAWVEANPRGPDGERKIIHRTPADVFSRIAANRILADRAKNGIKDQKEPRIEAGILDTVKKPADFVEGLDEERALFKEYIDAGLMNAPSEKDYASLKAMKGSPFENSMKWKLFGGHDKFDEAEKALMSKKNNTVEYQTGKTNEQIRDLLLSRIGADGDTVKHKIQNIKDIADDRIIDRFNKEPNGDLGAMVKDEYDPLNKKIDDYILRESTKGYKIPDLTDEEQTELDERMAKIKISPPTSRDGYTSIYRFKNKDGKIIESRVKVPGSVHRNGKPVESLQDKEAKSDGFRKTISMGQKTGKHLENRDDKGTKEILTTGYRSSLAGKGLGDGEKRRGPIPQEVKDRFGKLMTDKQLNIAWKAGAFDDDDDKMSIRETIAKRKANQLG